MNDIIKSLLEQKKKEEEKLNQLDINMHRLKESLHDEICKETALLNQVLKHNLIDIIKIIHECELLCVGVDQAEEGYHETVYLVLVHGYKFKIFARNGIVMRNNGIEHIDCNEFHFKKVDLLIQRLNSYCEEHKYKYIKKDS